MVNLRLLQLGDSALPVGGYTHSWGLETAIVRGLVNDAGSLECWTRSWLRFSLAPLEGVVVGAACRAAADRRWRDVFDANQCLNASLAPPTLRNASREMGEQLLELGKTWEWSRRQISEIASPAADNGRARKGSRKPAAPHESADGRAAADACWHYAVAFGVLAAIAGASSDDALGVFLHQAVLSMIAAGVRGIPVGHTHAQQILAYLNDDLEEMTRSSADRELQSAGSGCPYYEVLCYEQPRLYTRLFRS